MGHARFTVTYVLAHLLAMVVPNSGGICDPAQPLYIDGALPSGKALLLALPPQWRASDLPPGIWTRPLSVRSPRSGERHHDVALVDQDGTLIAKRWIGESVEDFAELLTLLAEAVAVRSMRGGSVRSRCWPAPPKTPLWRRTKAGRLALGTSRSDRGPSDPAAEVCVLGPGVDDIDHADQTSKPRAHLRGRVARRAGIPARWEPSGGVCRSRG